MWGQQDRPEQPVLPELKVFRVLLGQPGKPDLKATLVLLDPRVQPGLPELKASRVFRAL
jgi:hypothetical protein